MPRTSTIWPVRVTPSVPSGSRPCSNGAAKAGLADALVAVDPVAATREDLERVHPARYLDRIEGISLLGGGRLDPDTYASAGSWNAAVLAAGAGLTAVAKLQAGRGDSAFCAVRPPGHHATMQRVDGLLLRQQRRGRRRVARRAGRAGAGVRLRRPPRQRHARHLLRRPAGAVRQHPPVAAVPGHRPARRGGRRRGPRVHDEHPACRPAPPATCTSTRSTIWWPRGSTRSRPRGSSSRPASTRHRADPITELGLAAGDYAPLTRRVLSLVPAGRRLVMLEGGYDLDALANSAATVLREMADLHGDPIEPATSGGPGMVAVGAHARVLGTRRAAVIPRPVPAGPRRTRPARRPLPRRRPPPVPGGWQRARPVGRRRHGDHRLRLHHRRPARCHQEGAEGLGRRGVDPGREVRHHRRQVGDRTYEITTHRAEAYHEDSRKPEVEFSDQVEADLSRRDFTVNAMALELTSDTPDAGRPLRRRRRPADPHAAHAARARGQLQRRPAAHAARGPVHRPLRRRPGARVGRGRARDARPAGHRVGRARPRRARQADHPAHPTAGLWFAIDTGLADEFLPELPSMRLEQDPIHRHKDVLTHTLAVVENVRPPPSSRPIARRSTSAARAWPRCSTTSASRVPAATRRARASPSTTTTRWGRG